MTATIEGYGTQLMRAILQTPDDDTPRLAFADWLDEVGDHDRATYIREAIKLYLCGPEHKKVGYHPAPTVYLIPHGPDYWEVMGVVPVMSPGEVVDIRVEGKRTGDPKQFLHGLTVVHGWPTKQPSGRVIVKRTANSVAWKGKPHKKVCDGLLTKHQDAWLFDTSLPYSHLGVPPVYWERGFVNRIVVLAEALTRDNGAWAAHLFSRLPITEVTTDRRPGNGTGNGQLWGWWDTEQYEAREREVRYDPDDIEPEVWHLLERGDRTKPYLGWCHYPSREEAETALSKAFVKYGRKKARLE